MPKTTTNIKDIPQAELDRIRDIFEGAPQIRQLRIRQNLLQRQGDFRAAMNIGRHIEDLYAHTVSELLKEVDRQSENVDIASVNIPKETAGVLNELIVTLQMTIDILDTCVMDFNDTLHKADSALSLESFNDILDYGKKLKAKMQYFQKNSRLFNGLPFADRSDNMYHLLRNKARSLINKELKK